MREKGNDELSALMDGEATELEMHRVLRAIEEDPAQAAKWQRYHLTSAILKKEIRPCSAQQLLKIDLASRVSAALAEEPEIHHPADVPDQKKAPTATAPGWWRPAANVAIAASVATAVVLGWQQSQNVIAPAAQAPAVAHVSSSTTAGAVAVAPAAVPVQNVMPVQYGGIASVSPSYGVMPRSVSVPVEYVRPQKLDEQRFNHYLISHSGNAAFATQGGGQLPYVRVVTLKSVEAPR